MEGTGSMKDSTARNKFGTQGSGISLGFWRPTASCTSPWLQDQGTTTVRLQLDQEATTVRLPLDQGTTTVRQTIHILVASMGTLQSSSLSAT